MTLLRALRPRVVIAGAGFGGLACARALRRVRVDATIVERNNYFLFQPLLYQVASGLLDPSQIAYPVRSSLRRARNVRVLMAEVLSVDIGKRTLVTSAGALHFDYLVLATGSDTDFFGNDANRVQTESLKSLDDAISLRSHLLSVFEQAATCSDPVERRLLLTVAVVGGGPTGVEYAGAVAELMQHVLPRDYREIDFSEVQVVLVEAGERLLPAFAPSLSAGALRTLRRKGVDVHLRTSVRDIEGRQLCFDDGRRLGAGTMVWTAGVCATLPPSGLVSDRHGRVQVTAALSLPAHPDVFVIGDAASIQSREGTLPMLAPVAMQEGVHVAGVIASRLRGEPDPPFRYRDKGTMATIGRGAAVAQIGPIRINGLIGWLLWLFVHLLYLIGFRNRVIALATWGWNYFFYDRPVRLITGRPRVPATAERG